MIAGGLSADAHRTVGLVGFRDQRVDGPFDRRSALVEQMGQALGVPTHPQYELREIVRADGESVESLREIIGPDDV